MLPFFFKRLFWIVPTLVAVSILAFFFLSFVPPPAEASDGEARRSRFLDLPRFINLHPIDVRERARVTAHAIAKNDGDTEALSAELVRLGAAALPEILPTLDSYEPEERTRIAIALAPLAERMRIPNRERARDPANAVSFWVRFWDDRGVEFQTSSVRTAVDRLARYMTPGRAAEVEELDTYALDEVMRRLAMPETEDAIPGVRALTSVLSHVSERDDHLEADATLEEARACVRRWKAWWFVHQSDFVALDGSARASALVLETRYGKWASSVATSFMGEGASPALLRLADGARSTLVIVAGAVALAYSFGVALGILSAARRKRFPDIVIAFAVLGLYSIPTALLAILLLRAFGASSLVLPTVTVAAGLVAAPTRHQRSALLTNLSSDFIRAARARGVGPFGIYVKHALRTALVPLVTLVALEPPTALGAAFVVEHVFHVRGLGAMTIDAVNQHDIDFLMALALFSSTLAAILLVFADIAHALLDPRMRHRLTRGRA